MTCPAQTVMKPEEMWILGRTTGEIETVMILSIYTQKMFVSSPLKDDGLEDAPFLLRDDYHDKRTSPCSIGCTSSLIFVFWLSTVILWFWGEKHFAAAKFVKVPGSNTLILLIRPSF